MDKKNNVDQKLELKHKTYFIELKCFQIVRERVEPWMARSTYMWNSIPGALSVHPEYSHSLADFPFYKLSQGLQMEERFTAVVYATSPVVMYSSPLNKLVRHLSKSKYLDKVSDAHDRQPHSSPVRVSYGVSLVSFKFDAYSDVHNGHPRAMGCILSLIHILMFTINNP